MQYALGTNPLSFGAPGKDGDYFMLDMATSAVALGKVRKLICKTMMIIVVRATGGDAAP